MPWEREVVRVLRSRAFLADGLLAALLTGLSLPGLWISADQRDARPPGGLAIALTVVSCLPLVWRRRNPRGAFVATLLPAVALALLDYQPGQAGLPPLIALYSVAAYSDRTSSLACLTATLVGSTVVGVFDSRSTSLSEYLGTYGIFSAAFALGRGLQLRRAYVAEVEKRAEQLQARLAADTRVARAQERARIARELHDVVAHHVSVMTVQSAAARRMIDRDPARAGEAMAAVEMTGRQAMNEMRRIVGVLRDENEEEQRVPTPGVDDLQRLVEQVRGAGLPVELEILGAPRSLDTGAALTVFRVIQEALTNTLKHAGPARASVLVHYRAESLLVRVVDTGRGAAAGLASPAAEAGPGHGLPGMRERVTLYGGELRAGPRAGGGFQVDLSLPIPPVTAAPATTSQGRP